MGSVLRVVASAALIALGGCSQAPAPPAAKLWTLFDVQALYAGGAPGSQAIAANDGLPGGIPLDLISSPLASDRSSTLVARTAWADGQLVAFLTTEVWANYPQVWMQPAYVLVRRRFPGEPLELVGDSEQPIFSAGPTSGFYSPFVQIVYAEVPPDTVAGTLTSAKQILDGGYPLTVGDAHTMPLVPDNVALPSTTELNTYTLQGMGYLEGALVPYLDFGTSMFTWDPATNVVQEAPIYVLTFIGPDRSVLASPSIPTILGAGPPGSGVALPGGGQRNSAYYRVHTVVVPQMARVFAQPGSQLQIDLQADGLGAFAGFAPDASDLQIATFSGRVALNAGDPSQGVSGCFDDPTLLAADPANPKSCIWLASEAALQANLDLSTEETTAITVNWEVTDLVVPESGDVPVPQPAGPL